MTKRLVDSCNRCRWFSTDCVATKYASKLQTLCDKGHVCDALTLTDKMYNSGRSLSTTHFSTMLDGCIVAEFPSLYSSVWHEFTNKYHVIPNSRNFCVAIKAANQCGDINGIDKLLNQMERQKIHTQFSTKDWNMIIESFVESNNNTNNTQSLKNSKITIDYISKMQQFGHEPNGDTLSILLGYISEISGNFQFDEIVKELVLLVENFLINLSMKSSQDKQNKMIIISNTQLTRCLNYLRQLGKQHLCHPLWCIFSLNKNRNDIDNICYSLTILCLSEINECNLNNLTNFKTLDIDIDLDFNFDWTWQDLLISKINELVDMFLAKLDSYSDDFNNNNNNNNGDNNGIYLNHILTAYGNLKEFDKMWFIYDKMINKYKIIPSVSTLSILTRFEKRIEWKKIALKQIEKYIGNDFSRLTYRQAKGFYRTAVECNQSDVVNKLSKILQQNTDAVEVCAKTYLKGKLIVFDRSYDKSGQTENFIKESNYSIDISQFPEISPKLAYLRLVNHCEKKALAFLVNKCQSVSKIDIQVTLRMCKDCHAFFCHISRQYPNITISCRDPQKMHVFVNGSCNCCNPK